MNRRICLSDYLGPKSYAAFLAYVALGARRSVREAALADPSVRPRVNTMSKLRHLGPKSRR